MTKLNDLIHHCVEYGDCFLWKRAKNGGSHPVFRKDGKTRLVRRVLWESENGAIPKGNIIRVTCGEVSCINPAHFSLITIKKLCQELGALGVMGGIKRISAIQKTKREKYSKLSIEEVNSIRASNDTSTNIARTYNLSISHVCKIRKNKAWVNYQSPFAGLLK